MSKLSKEFLIVRNAMLKKITTNKKIKPTKMDKNIVYVPCDENDKNVCGGYTSTDGRSLCYVKPISIDELVKEKTKVLTETLKIVHESLKTYGSHPIIDRQVFKALTQFTNNQ